MFHTELYTYSCRILSPYNISFIVVSTSCTQPFQTFTTCQWLFHSSMHFLYNYFAQVNTSQRFITVFTICTHSWDLISLQPFFHWLFHRTMYTTINHVKPLQPSNDCLQVCISCTKLLRTSAILFSWLNGLSLITVFSASSRCTASYYISYHCTSRVTHSKLNSLSPS